jgi:hypothetical protein
MSLRYTVVGTIDGFPLNSSNTRLQLTNNAVPLPSALWIRINSDANYSTALTRLSAPTENQAVSLALRIITSSFSNKLEYDPDISITLLFNPENLVEAPNVAAQAPVIAAVATSVIVGVCIAAVLIAAIGALVFAKFVFPYVGPPFSVVHLRLIQSIT